MSAQWSAPRKRWVAACLSVLAAVWWAVDAFGNLQTLIDAARSRSMQWLLAHAEVFLIVAALLFTFWSVRPHPVADARRALETWRERLGLRYWTSAGLNWRVIRASHGLTPDGRMRAILAISPIPGSELPQPLHLSVACAGQLQLASPRFHPDKSKAIDDGPDWEMEAAQGKSVRLTLRSPKLLPPARLDISLESAGNAEVRVMSVKRAPE